MSSSMFYDYLVDNENQVLESNLENDPAGRFFIVVYNSTTTVSAAYATLIALAIAAIIGALLGGLYYLLLSAKSEMSSGGYESSRFFKRSSEDESPEDWSSLQILEKISNFEEKFSTFRRQKECNLADICRKMALILILQKKEENVYRNTIQMLSDARQSLPNRTVEDDSSVGYLKSYLQAADYGAYGGNCVLMYSDSQRTECNNELSF